jgi:AAA ATPase domain
VDPIRNPYTPNAGSRPPELAGRGAELEQFRVLVGRLGRGATEQSMIIRGLRGVGKTALLNIFEDQAEAAGFLTYYHELTPGMGLVDQLARDAQAALSRLKLSARLVAAIRSALGHLATIKVTGPEGIGLAVDLRRADEATLASDLSQLFVQLGQAAREGGSGVVLLLDEVQFADAVQFRALISALHRATQRNLPITTVAAGLPQIPKLTGEARTYAERLFTFPVIGNLAEADATAALVEPARAQGVDYDDDAVVAALEWTAGYPFYIQQLGKHAWNLAAESPITAEVIERAKPAAQRALDGTMYEVRIQRATNAERRYMRAMAELGSGPYRTGNVARMLGRPTTAVSPLRQSLLEKGLVYATESYGYIDFTAPRFDQFMRRQMPYRRPRRRAASRRSKSA